MPLTHQQKKSLNIANQQSYVMASDDSINTKLEAIEARMEDKLHALFEKFRLGRSRSPKRSQREKSLDHKENPREKGDQAPDSSCPCMSYHKTSEFPHGGNSEEGYADLKFEEEDAEEEPQPATDRTLEELYGD
ncbi:hypothetical protein B296_00020248 [Ensete ventricosum]|uniref:Uncharacterized protein n=1 Tax=Ensete ventricosum TaxID=4639 RepID=A0A427AX97_ENSVE|nr:hypothetical protein B296_00020248 [Ensete ventricosum]